MIALRQREDKWTVEPSATDAVRAVGVFFVPGSFPATVSQIERPRAIRKNSPLSDSPTFCPTCSAFFGLKLPAMAPARNSEPIQNTSIQPMASKISFTALRFESTGSGLVGDIKADTGAGDLCGVAIGLSLCD